VKSRLEMRSYCSAISWGCLVQINSKYSHALLLNSRFESSILTGSLLALHMYRSRNDMLRLKYHLHHPF